jgi:hypothetical protein
MYAGIEATGQRRLPEHRRRDGRPALLRSAPMKRIFIALVALTPSLALPAAPTGPDMQSLKLITALRLRDVIVQTSSTGIAAAQKQGAASDAGTKCVAQKLFNNLGAELALVVPKILTREEIAESVKFFESPTGRKLIGHNLALFWSQQGGKPNAAYPDAPPTAEDTKLARAFLSTPAGRKINESGYLLQAPEMQQVIKLKSDAAIAMCKRQAAAPAAK